MAILSAPIPTSAARQTLGAGNGVRRDIRQAGRNAQVVLNKGTNIGQDILPEVFPGGSGLDRIDFQNISPERVSFDSITPERADFSKINQFLQPSVDEALAYRNDTTGLYDELLGLRRDKLGGLNAAENQALRDSLYRQIDRERQGALRDVSRTPGLGAGAAFGQRRALGQDYRNAALDADRNLLLTNIDLKRQALNDLEGTTGARQSALGSAADRISALRGLQATAQQATDQFNANNKLTADQFNSTGKLNAGQFNANNALAASQFNSTGQFNADQFNAAQQKDELAARVGAISAGTGLVGDERDRAQAEKIRKQMMDFLRERDQSLFNQAQTLFG